MIAVLIAIVIVVGIALLIALYLTLLRSLYPEHIRTNEVYHVRTNDLWVLRVCRYRKNRATGEPVLLVHGMLANQHDFTSPENGCLVDYLCDKGYDCWTVDLRGARSSQPPFERTRNDVRMEDFFTEDLPAVVAHILRTTNYAKLHWIGNSMGGMLLYAYTQYHGGDQIVSGTTLGSPFDFNDAAGEMSVWPLSFAEKCPVAAGNAIRGIVPFVKLLRGGPQAFPINHNNLPKSMNVGHFINMLEDPLPALMRQVKDWMRTRTYTLLDGELDISAGISSLPTPLLAFYAARDPFIDAERALTVFNTIQIEDKKAVVCAKEKGFVEDYSHCDLAFSKEAAKEIFEPIAQWLAEHPCPLKYLDENDLSVDSATVLSPEKRAEILSGAAFSHVTSDEAALNSPSPDTQDMKTGLQDVAGATAAEPGESPMREHSGDTAGAADTPTAPAYAAEEAKEQGPRPATKRATRKTSARTSTAKKSTAKKASAAKKTTAAKSAATKKKAASKKPAPKKKAVEDVMDNEESRLSPEDQERAERLREARNMAFSDIMASLEATGKPETEDMRDEQ